MTAVVQVPSNGAQLPQDLANSLVGQVSGMGKDTSFAKSMLDLLEVTAQISQLDKMVEDAQSVGEEESSETRKWKEISTMSAQFARSNLLERQLAAIDSLIDLGARGGSLVKEASDRVDAGPLEASALPPMPVLPAKVSAGTGGDSPLASASEGEDAGPGATGAAKCVIAPPPGLAAPPGLEHLAPSTQAPAAPAPVASVRVPQRPPPGLGFSAPRKPACAGAQVRVQEEKSKAPVFASSCMAVNLDAYDDDDEE